jgi:hypothetical protein
MPRSRRLMLTAIAIMAVSQFMNYVAPHEESGRVLLTGVYVTRAVGGTVSASQHAPGETGWSIHPHAKLVLIALALLFLANPDLGAGWRRWQFWLATIAMLCFCLFPLKVEYVPGWGALVGLIAVIFDVRAARARKAEVNQ